ncbi:3-(3-hydroxy-phenyl)propionate/3-hydroxycinnamic acid hydroxylase (plasmid) [Sulfitobacter pontiacus]|uniref:3-(3-hydroxy-phenyl)propionate/3-hydroxycinnamic acid hydroxylase n=1 Tax=Sulfitobacter pontiacus TaxID=60137 RepID=A0AAX3AG58_9RHOB|nr:FAD-dependent oxidoreductase [Sulfitobacter pontiacus]UOA25102.1 3-(3-hydroxy-phenyl)propionate/3-hydroxycinnamic acid hydroxylase [Sulfitobacter pontiacus]WPZ27266.1 FAD-dependent oxidoreductase [Sulfitobacter pontiacus]
MVDVRYDIAFKLYPYQKGADQDLAPRRHPVVIVGGGPVGMALALDLGRKGTPVVVLDDHEGVGQGSRAICFAKRTLEICDRLGAGKAMIDKGVQWNVGKVFHGDERVFEFNLQPEDGHRAPAFINLQQPYFEKYLVDEIRVAQSDGAPIEIRGRNAVTGVTPQGDHVVLDINTPDGPYQLEADWLVACDGARSPTREMLGLSFEGRVFEDNFLIADVKMKADFPTERWFWFEPPFKDSGASALLHKQPDDIWRIDFQLGWDIDRAKELKPENIRARVDAMLGEGAEYELEWTSIYTFQCRRMEKFRHGRVLFAGDSAHQVSPFGARGANSGVQDADNLAWKLDLVIKGLAPDRLLDSYSQERVHGADENILNSTRATDFLTPKTEMSKIFRNAVLSLAHRHPFARPLVNSGRLSVPCVYDGLSLNGPDALNGPATNRVGATCSDAPLRDGFLLDVVGGVFTVLAINTDPPALAEVGGITVNTVTLNTQTDDPSGAIAARYLGDAPCGIYLIRPDQHVAARWAHASAADIRSAVGIATGKGQ